WALAVELYLSARRRASPGHQTCLPGGRLDRSRDSLMITPDLELLAALEAGLPNPTRARLATAVERIVSAKQRGRKVAVVTGSGPNVHEGVTTLLAELMRVGIVDGVTTSSAVIAHEMGGTLDRVKRCAGEPLGIAKHLLPRGGEFELTLLDDEILAD